MAGEFHLRDGVRNVTAKKWALVNQFVATLRRTIPECNDEFAAEIREKLKFIPRSKKEAREMFDEEVSPAGGTAKVGECALQSESQPANYEALERLLILL